MNAIDNKHIGAYEAKTHLSDLLDRVERGEELVITRHGKPVARLIPAQPGHDVAKAKVVVRNLIELREQIRQDMLARGEKLFTLDEILSSIQDGRRY